jgi:hypothetical protein
MVNHSGSSIGAISFYTVICNLSPLISNACILKAHSHSKGGASIWASLECQCCFWTAGGLISYLTMWLLTLQLFKNSINTQGKLRLNLHSLSVSVSELLEYRRKKCIIFCNIFKWKITTKESSNCTEINWGLMCVKRSCCTAW